MALVERAGPRSPKNTVSPLSLSLFPSFSPSHSLFLPLIHSFPHPTRRASMAQRVSCTCVATRALFSYRCSFLGGISFLRPQRTDGNCIFAKNFIFSDFFFAITKQGNLTLRAFRVLCNFCFEGKKWGEQIGKSQFANKIDFN